MALALPALFVAVGLAVGEGGSDQQGQITFSGLPVPGAVVTATQGQTNVTTVSDEDGRYRLVGLASGVWTIRIEISGFAASSREVTLPSDVAPLTWSLTLLSFEEITRRRVGPPPALPRASRPAVSDESSQDGATDGLLINGSVNNAAASPFAQPRAFGNNRPQEGARYSGSLGLVGASSNWDARPFSFTNDRSPKPSYIDVRIVGTFGGPLKLPRVTTRGSRFFVGYHGSRDHAVSTASAVMPTLMERRGDFSHTVDSLGDPAQIRDPVTGEAFDRGLIPPGRMSPQAAALLAYYAEPNLTDGGRHNYQAPVVSVTRQHDVQLRWNHTIGRSLLSGTVAYQRTNISSTSLFGFEDVSRVEGIDTAVNWNRRLNPRLALRLRYQFTHLTSRATPYFANRTNVSGEAGIGGNNQDGANWGPPTLVFPDVATLTDGQHQFSRVQTHAGGAEAYVNRGRHNITFGGDMRRHHTDVVSQQDPRGTLVFTGAATGLAFADFLLGIPTTSSIAFGNADKYFRSSSYDAYVNDDARLTPTLTVTFGLRWEYEAPVTEALGRLVNLDVAPNFAAIGAVVAGDPAGPLTGRSFPASLVRPDKTGFQPRVGLAWRPVPGSSLVLRAGYGIYRNTAVYLPIAKLLAQQPPLSKTFSVQNRTSDPFTLANAFTAPPAVTSNTFAVDSDFRVGYAHNWQVSAQRDLPASLLVSATYLGAKGSRLMQQVLPNTYPAGAVDPCPACPAGFVYLTSSGSSSRHAGRLLLRRRLRNGLAASAQYTIAKAIDDASTFSGASLPGASVAQNWLDLDAERAPSNFDQRHLLAVQFEYTTGAAKTAVASMDGWRGSLLKGWTIAGQLTAGSGLPLTPLYVAPVSGTGTVGVRPDLTGAPVTHAPPGYYLNPGAYAPPAPGRWGNAGRNSISGPVHFTCDASAARTILLGDRLNLEWRVEATNILNRVTYARVNTFVGSPQFGLPNLANPMRKVQTSLRLRF